MHVLQSTTTNCRKLTEPSQPALADAAPLVSAGFAIHWLRTRSKAPVEAAWSAKPVETLEQLKKNYTAGRNLGIRPGQWSATEAGYLHIIDVDVRDESKADEAHAKVRELFDPNECAIVISGSGGSSRHFYIFCERPFDSKKLFHSKGFKMVWDQKKGREVKKWDWEIELLGTGKQAVIPPSIHPDTGRPYVWERPLDLRMIEMGLAPTVPAETVESWAAWASDREPDSLAAPDQLEPLGIELDEASDLIFDLPEEWVEDRDQWLQVGMGLHHEFDGDLAARDLWAEWSAQSEKYDEKDLKRVWKSFGEARGRPVRMATIKKAVMEARFAAEFDDLDDLDDDEPAETIPATQDRVSALLDDSPDDRISALLDDSDAEIVQARPDDLMELERDGVPFDREWRSKLQITEEGTIKVTLHNVTLIMKNDPRFRGIACFNEFTQEVVLRREPGRLKMKKESPKGTLQLEGDVFKVKDPVNGDLWMSEHDNAMRFLLEAPARQGGFGIKVSDRDLRAAIDNAAREHGFHPIRRAIEFTEWDGVARLDHLFVDYLGTPDTAYHRDAARWTLVAAVARVFEPGHKFDTVPVLEGAQGRGKSTFCRVLAILDCWFSELQGDFSDTKGMVENMQGSLILELPELQGLSKAEVTDVKAFISRQRDKARLAYETRAREFPRQSIIIGTTNEDTYLRDLTGGRRFWPIRVEVDQIDTERLKANVLQIWAEALHVYRSMRAEQPKGTLPLYLRNEEAQAEAEQMQESRRLESVEEQWAGEIEAWLETPLGDGFEDLDGVTGGRRDRVCAKEIWVDLMGQDASRLDQRTSNIIGKAMRLVPGWSNHPKVLPTAKHGRPKCFVRLDPRA